MSLRLFTTQEKLVLVEELIEAQRAHGFDDRHRIALLKAIAADLRANLNGAPTVALVELERRLASVARSKTRLGYEQGAMTGVAEEVIARWPTIKQALEKFGAES